MSYIIIMVDMEVKRVYMYLSQLNNIKLFIKCMDMEMAVEDIINIIHFLTGGGFLGGYKYVTKKN